MVTTLSRADTIDEGYLFHTILSWTDTHGPPVRYDGAHILNTLVHLCVGFEGCLWENISIELDLTVRGSADVCIPNPLLENLVN